MIWIQTKGLVIVGDGTLILTEPELVIPLFEVDAVLSILPASGNHRTFHHSPTIQYSLSGLRPIVVTSRPVMKRILWTTPDKATDLPQPLRSPPRSFSARVVSHHPRRLPAPLRYDLMCRRAGARHAASHPDPPAMPGVARAHAGSHRSRLDAAGDRRHRQPEDRRGDVAVLRPNGSQGSHRSRCHVDSTSARVRLRAPHSEPARSVIPHVHIVPDERRRPASDRTRQSAISTRPRRRAASGYSRRPPRPILGMQAVSLIAASTPVVSAPTCRGGRAFRASPLIVSITI